MLRRPDSAGLSTSSALILSPLALGPLGEGAGGALHEIYHAQSRHENTPLPHFLAEVGKHNAA
jgi:hypothetical protein